MSGLVFAIWIGGMYPAYMHYREHQGPVWSAMNALAWPIDFGSWVAEKIYDERDGEDDAE